MSVQPQPEFFPEFPPVTPVVFDSSPALFEAWDSLCKVHGCLVDVPLAAFLSNRSAASIRSAMLAGRFTRVDFGGAILLPLGEVKALSRAPKYSRANFTSETKGSSFPRPSLVVETAPTVSTFSFSPVLVPCIGGLSSAVAFGNSRDNQEKLIC